MYRSPVDDSLMVVGRSVVVVSRETRERARVIERNIASRGGAAETRAKDRYQTFYFRCRAAAPHTEPRRCRNRNGMVQVTRDVSARPHDDGDAKDDQHNHDQHPLIANDRGPGRSDPAHHASSTIVSSIAPRLAKGRGAVVVLTRTWRTVHSEVVDSEVCLVETEDGTILVSPHSCLIFKHSRTASVPAYFAAVMTVSAHVPGHPELDQAPGDPAQSPQNCVSKRISYSPRCITSTALTVMSVAQHFVP
jgi:hypothetical protein